MIGVRGILTEIVPVPLASASLSYSLVASYEWELGRLTAVLGRGILTLKWCLYGERGELLIHYKYWRLGPPVRVSDRHAYR